MRALPRWQISRFLTSFLIITREIEYQSVNSNSYVLICDFVRRNNKVSLQKIMSELLPLVIDGSCRRKIALTIGMRKKRVSNIRI